MRNRVISGVGAVLLGTALLAAGGCASTSEIDKLRNEVRLLQRTADDAQRTAQAADQKATAAQTTANEALQSAKDANACCAANTEKLDRAFKKSMTK